MKYLPPLDKIIVELLTVLIASIGAAYIISLFPKLSSFVSSNSVTLHVED